MFNLMQMKYKFLNRIWSHFSPCNSHSTIYALSSGRFRGQGKCGVAVIRISGPNSEAALKSVTKIKELPKPRQAILKNIYHPQTNDILDKALVLWFPGPKSFTGEDVCELHVHGGLAVINGVMNALSTIPKLRVADAGEFTRRAFHSGKLDLTAVEGLADLLQAETEAQRKQAFLQSQGALSMVYHGWREKLLKSVAHVEAHIDFEETETLEHGLLESVAVEVKFLVNEMRKHLNDGRKGETLRNGVKTVIIGEPNVGKSSLFNLLCQRPAAIVTPLEGTTRDILEVTLNIGGYPLVLVDTAGLRSKTDDIIEKEGINRALKIYDEADLIILVIDMQKYVQWHKSHNSSSFALYLKEYLRLLNIETLINFDDKTESVQFSKQCIVVLNKTDLCNLCFDDLKNNSIVKFSCKTEEGVSDLLDDITNNLKILCGEPSKEHPSMNQIRHRQEVTKCHECLEIFLKLVPLNGESECDIVVLAEHLRKALRHLGKLVGTVTTEQLLDVIFKDFCIGK